MTTRECVTSQAVGLFVIRDGSYVQIIDPNTVGKHEDLIELYAEPQPRRVIVNYQGNAGEISREPVEHHRIV